MGEIAARTLLGRINGNVKYVPEIAVEPELVVRKSTAAPMTEVPRRVNGRRERNPAVDVQS